MGKGHALIVERFCIDKDESERVKNAVILHDGIFFWMSILFALLNLPVYLSDKCRYSFKYFYCLNTQKIYISRSTLNFGDKKKGTSI